MSGRPSQKHFTTEEAMRRDSKEGQVKSDSLGTDEEGESLYIDDSPNARSRKMTA